jgi:UDP-3-O-[3-hydroxymyristoyl] glucosamine N-acyltransferase
VLAGPGIDLGGRTSLVVPDPYLALAMVLDLYHPPAPVRPGVSREAVIGSDCRIDEGAEIRARAVIGDRCRIGPGSRIGSGAVLGSDVSVGRDTTVHPNVTIYDGCVLGDRVIIHAGAVIGSDGFGYAVEKGRRRKIPQTGIVSVEDDVEIGANTTIDRATFGATVIGRGSKVDNLVQIGHNVVLGEDCVLVAQVGLSGSVKIGRRVVFAGQSGAVGHIDIGDDVTVGA